MNGPLISVVVPTRDRNDAVQRLLRALAADTSAPPLEVIVVDDGSSDGTGDALRQLSPRYPFTLIEQHGHGPARARNAGAAVARGQVLLFLDDDVEPLPGTLAAHAAFHRGHELRIGIGDLPVVVDETSYFGRILRGWWEMMLVEMRKPGHRFAFTNLLTGHVSIRRARFDALRGFDPELRCHEDWEFGYRALEAGLQLGFVPGAVARHHETSDLAKAFGRKFDEGVADIRLTERHPELACAFPFSWPIASRKARALRRLIFVAPHVATRIAQYFERLLRVYEVTNLRFRWRRTLELLLVYHYWRGVRSVVPDRRDVSALIQLPEPSPANPFTVDLASGLDTAARHIDSARPSSMVLVLGDELIGVVREWPGLEPLRGEHLRPLLARGFRQPYLRALARRGAVPAALMVAAPALSEAGGNVTHTGTPFVRDVELPAQSGVSRDLQHRTAVPPVHDVA